MMIKMTRDQVACFKRSPCFSCLIVPLFFRGFAALLLFQLICPLDALSANDRSATSAVPPAATPESSLIRGAFEAKKLDGVVIEAVENRLSPKANEFGNQAVFFQVTVILRTEPVECNIC